ncbi:MAG: UPF0149 family protein, partial [Betaproteobacteria bacterium]|nr:UPF0149 family protein [Betaproteobacteria bacterium]
GYLTAIVSAPNAHLPSEWQPWIWDLERGETPPQFKSLEEAQRIQSLIFRHMNTIATTLAHAPEEYEPLLYENLNDGQPVAILDEWCMGYVKGIGLAPSDWQPLVKEYPVWLETIILYGTKAGWEKLDAADLTLAQHQDRVLALPDEVRKIYGYWREGALPGVSGE